MVCGRPRGHNIEQASQTLPALNAIGFYPAWDERTGRTANDARSLNLERSHMDVTMHIPDGLAERLGAGADPAVERSKPSHWRHTGAAHRQG